MKQVELTQTRLNDYARNAMTAGFPQDVVMLASGGRELVFHDMETDTTIAVEYSRSRNIVRLSYFETSTGELKKEYLLESRELELRAEIKKAEIELGYQRHIAQTSPVAEFAGEAAARALQIARNIPGMRDELRKVVSENNAV